MGHAMHAAAPTWLRQAEQWIGLSEQAGRASHPEIVAFYADAGHPDVRDDSVAWCAAFVGACLARSGITPTGSLRARSYLGWGEPITEPRRGAVAIFSRGKGSVQGHVGFLIEEAGDRIHILGGNQGDRVSRASFPRTRLLGYRWPLIEESRAEISGFERALAHVLALEGGFVDDPQDPGGPTRAGVTLATFADHLGIPLVDATRGELRQRLAALSDAEIATVYRVRFWRRVRCEALPPPLALMHFDAAVNHGTGRAVRMLQSAVGASVDGEIGPETLSRCQSADPAGAVGRYAAGRRAAYRRLPAFARYGRGWLARVETTRTAALALIGSSTTSQSQAKETDMQAKPQTQRPKWWGGSITIWGVLVTALTAVLPALGPLVGLEISAEIADAIGRELTNFAQGGGGLLGTVIAIYGRLRARGPLIRKRLSLTV
jgi:uncharacterized protein (TIGR02594 family)